MSRPDLFVSIFSGKAGSEHWKRKIYIVCLLNFYNIACITAYYQILLIKRAFKDERIFK